MDLGDIIRITLACFVGGLTWGAICYVWEYL